MKRISLFLFAGIVFGLVGCGNKASNDVKATSEELMCEDGQTITEGDLYIDDSLDAPVRSGVAAQSEPSESGSPTSWFVKTRYKCQLCKCTGYWGIYHTSGMYEGKCSNSDGNCHSCKHGPEKHGLRRW